MACIAYPLAEAPVAEPGPRRMTRCECAGVTFAELGRRVGEEALSPEEACLRTGCGQTCTACLPDLRQYLASRRA